MVNEVMYQHVIMDRAIVDSNLRRVGLYIAGDPTNSIQDTLKEVHDELKKRALPSRAAIVS
jgi:hypothetical protein